MKTSKIRTYLKREKESVPGKYYVWVIEHSDNINIIIIFILLS